VAELQGRVDAGGGHRRLQARLKGPRISMSEEAETIVLLATALAKKGEGQAAMQRRALLVRVVLDFRVDIVRQVVMLLKQP
jgi:hypothetical protein